MSDDRKSTGFEGVEAGPDSSDRAGTETPVMPEGVDRAHPTVNALVDTFGDAVLRTEVTAGDQHVVYVEESRSFEILEWLKDSEDHQFNYLSDVTAIDFGGGRPIQVVYQLFSIPLRRALRLKVELPLDALEIDSVEPLWKAADWLEREVWDLFGVRFRNHPNLRRILMPEHYAEGHPLRKDFPLRGRFSRAEQTRRALEMDADDYYVDRQRGPGRKPQVVQWQELGAEPVPVDVSPMAPESHDESEDR